MAMVTQGQASGAGGSVRQPTADDIIGLKLMQLNLHQALAHSFKVQQLFHDLQEKQDTDYIFGKGFIAESTMDIQEALSRVFFHLNAITRGKHIDLYLKLDELKRRITTLFNTASSSEVSGSGNGAALPDDDETSLLLRRAVDQTARISLADTDIMDTTLSETSTAHDLLIYCFKLLFDAADSRMMGLAAGADSVSAGRETITMLPISYLDEDSRGFMEGAASSTPASQGASPNKAAEMLTAGIDEVSRSDLYGFRQAPVNRDDRGRGILLYSRDTVTLYHLSTQSRTVITANVYDAVTGNYIYLLITPRARHESTALANLMVEKLLYWLDFETFRSHMTILAGIKNMSRNEMQNHLNMLGKMLLFVAAPKISPANDADVRRNIDIFLEQVV